MSLYEEKHQLYADYLSELDKFRKKPLNLSREECRKICDDYISSKNSSWLNIYDGNELAGFLIMGKKDPEKHPDSERSVAQAFVRKQSRNKGLMTWAIKDYESRHHCVYSLLIVDGNEYAKKFWDKRFEELGYEKCYLDDTVVKANDGELVLEGYRPKETQ